MENQTDYERAAANAWRTFQDIHHEDCLIGIRKIFDDAFIRGYRSGFEDAKAEVETGNAIYIQPPMSPFPRVVPEAEKKVDRTMIAAMAMQGILSNSQYLCALSDKLRKTDGNDDRLAESVAKEALYYTDALINELNRTEL